MEKNWEYLVERISSNNEEGRLSELGALGWQLITLMSVEEYEYFANGDRFLSKYTKYYFKRLKEQ